MQISIANAIQVARRIGAAAAEVITTNLKMWLGFETSETLGAEKVVNGDFATDSDWSEGTGWDIDEANNKATHTGAGGIIKQTFSNLIVGRHYVASVTLNSVGDTTLSNTSFQIRNNTDTASVAQLLSSSGDILADEINYLTLNFTATQVNNIIRVYSADNIFVTDFSVKEITQITPDKSGNNNVGKLFTGKALEFDGNLDSVTFSSYPTSIKSVVFWYKPLANEAFDSIIWLGGSSRGTIAISNNQGTINCTNLLGKVIYVNGVQTESVTLNQWQRVVINFPSKTLLGLSFAKVGLNYGDCQLSDIQFYNEDLSLDDIAYDYANPQNLLTDREGTSVVLADLRGYWALSEGAGSIVYDSSGGNHNGTISGATYEPAQPRIPQLGMMNFSNGAVATGVTLIPDPNNTSQDILGNAVRDRLNSFNLDGSGYAEVADADDLDFGTGDFTIECWAKFDFENKGSQWNSIVSLGDSIVSTTSAGLATKVGKFYFNIGGTTTIGSTPVLVVGDWYHVVGTRTGTTMRLYINTAVESITATSAQTVTNTGSKIIGDDAAADKRAYENLISDVRLYSVALSATEIENNYNAGLSAHTND